MTTRDPIKLWEDVWRAGGIDAYVERQVRDLGFLVKRRETDGMSEREKKKYKAELKKEAAERKRLRKEAWEAKKAAQIVHLGEHVFWSDAVDFDRFDLPEAEERAAENRLPQLEKPIDLARALGITVAELRWFTYHREAALAHGVHYKRFTITKRDGSERAIWAPLPRLKKIQRWILREIVEHLPVHGAAHGFMPHRSIATHAAVHSGSKVLVQMDVRHFFPTVTLPRVKGLFPQGGLPREDRDAAGAAVHGSAARGRRARGQDVVRRARPALPAAGSSDQSGDHQCAVPEARPAPGRFGREARLALQPLRRRPDVQSAGQAHR